MNEPRYLQIPLRVPAYIPLDMTQEEYDLILATLELWKPRLVVPVYVVAENQTAEAPSQADAEIYCRDHGHNILNRICTRCGFDTTK